MPNGAIVSPGTSAAEPIARWPADRLEAVAACPVCRGERRERLYEGLTDRVFFCAPGAWTLYRCLGCRSGYLDPRPTPQSIGLAYTTYCTHERPTLAVSRAPTWLRRFRAALRNDYLRSRYGRAMGAAIPLGRLAVYLALRRRLNIERSVRHVRPPAPQARLLDIGCGNGQFLTTAQALGWEARGIDPDRKAVAAAGAAGLRVGHGGLPKTQMPDQYFDAVTMNHVIEHLHDPIGALVEVRRLLKPGGTVWIATPNLDSLGSRCYRASWRGLEPPRHLVLFTVSSLKLACSLAGFPVLSFRRSLQAMDIFSASERLARGQSPFGSDALKGPLRRRWLAYGADFMTLLRPRLGEEMVAIARN